MENTLLVFFFFEKKNLPKNLAVLILIILRPLILTDLSFLFFVLFCFFVFFLVSWLFNHDALGFQHRAKEK